MARDPGESSLSASCVALTLRYAVAVPDSGTDSFRESSSQYSRTSCGSSSRKSRFLNVAMPTKSLACAIHSVGDRNDQWVLGLTRWWRPFRASLLSSNSVRVGSGHRATQRRGQGRQFEPTGKWCSRITRAGAACPGIPDFSFLVTTPRIACTYTCARTYSNWAYNIDSTSMQYCVQQGK